MTCDFSSATATRRNNQTRWPCSWSCYSFCPKSRTRTSPTTAGTALLTTTRTVGIWRKRWSSEPSMVKNWEPKAPTGYDILSLRTAARWVFDKMPKLVFPGKIHWRMFLLLSLEIKWRMGSDGDWVQDSNFNQAAYHGLGPHGHRTSWSGVWPGHRPCVLLIKQESPTQGWLKLSNIIIRNYREQDREGGTSFSGRKTKARCFTEVAEAQWTRASQPLGYNLFTSSINSPNSRQVLCGLDGM